MKDNKCKYGILNKENVVGLLYENDSFGKILVMKDNNVDLDFDIKIVDVHTGKTMESLDIKEWLTKTFIDNLKT